MTFSHQQEQEREAAAAVVANTDASPATGSKIKMDMF